MLTRSISVFAVSLAVLLAAQSTATAANKPFVTGSALGATTTKFKWKIKKPSLKRGQQLDVLQIKGCWLTEGVKSIKITNKKGKKVKSKRNTSNGALEIKKLTSSDFPLTVTTTFTSARAVTAGGSAVVAQSIASCSVKKKNPCAKAPPLEAVTALPGANCALPHDFQENTSPGSIVLVDGDVFDLFAVGSFLRFGVSGESFNGDLTDASVVIDGQAFSGADLALDGAKLIMKAGALTDGLHTVTVSALDAQGRQLKGDFQVWAGANTLTVRLSDQSGQPLNDGTIKFDLGDNKEITKTLPLSNGQAVFVNVPTRTVALTASTPDKRTGFLATTGNAGTVTIPMLGFSTPSAIANNDISQGSAGWNIGTGPVKVVPHVEDETPAAAQTGDPDQDLVLTTKGIGAQFMSRVFELAEGTKAVTVRYKFTTSEFPGGYFGSRYNDYFNIAIRTAAGLVSGETNDGNSMNALGKGAFSPSGSTAWRTVTFPVKKGGGTVQVDVGVANVADGAFDSSVTVDFVKESSFVINSSALLDIDGSELRFISGDDHPYFDRFTHIWGTIKIEGNKDDSIKSLELQVLEGTKQVATGKLSTQLTSKLINKKFGKTGFLEVKDPVLLFKIFPKEATALNSTTNKTYTLRIKATSSKNEVAEADGGSVGLLVRFKGTSRYDGRDVAEGGDDWVKPTVRAFADGLGVTYGDFSNMNGGSFPPHEEHNTGNSIDAWVEGYNARDEATAESLIAILNGPGGSRIRTMYVTYSRTPGDPFFRAIQRQLLNGRGADRVILPLAGHTTHFHMSVGD